MTDSIGTLLFKDKQIRLLLILTDQSKEWNITNIAKESNVTYVHTSRFIKRCEEQGLVKSTRHGRIKQLILTEKGIQIAGSISSIMEKINAIEPQKPAAQQK